MSIFKDHLFNTEKIDYVKGKKPDYDCILCAIRDHQKDVKSLEIFRSEGFIVTVNLYPFNPGHLMIFPIRHIIDLSEFTQEEAIEMHELTVKTLSIIKEEFTPTGFNIGYNLGEYSGASISHLHQHIVPRYNNEIGFIDVLAGTRLFVVDPVEVMKRLKSRFDK